MILFVGQIGVGHKEREAFQEVDYRAFFGSMAKWATEIDDVDRIPEILARAWRIAISGRPWPRCDCLARGYADSPNHSSALPASYRC